MNRPRQPCPTSFDARSLVEAWESMSAHYLPGRRSLLDVVTAELVHRLAGRQASIVELGSGPGTFVRALASGLPDARIVAFDADPVLAAIHRTESVRTGLGPTEVVSVDLGTSAWRSSVAGPVDAVVAIQVLHYFARPRFAEMLVEIRELLAPDGVFVHLDVVPSDDEVLEADDQATAGNTAAAADASHADPWSQWWAAARDEPALADEFAGRDLLAPARGPSAEFHPDERQLNAMLSTAGFEVIETVDRVGNVAVTVAHMR